jgi:membrane protein
VHVGIRMCMVPMVREANDSASVGGTPDPNAQSLEQGSPARLTWPDWKQSLKGALAHAKSDRLSVVAGSLAYRWFLSLFPILIVLLGVAALAHIPHNVLDKLIHGASKALPAGASGVITTALRHAASRTSGAIGAVVAAGAVALWSATSSMSVLQSGFDLAYEVPTDRKFLAKRLVSLEMMIAAGVLAGAASALIVFGAQVGLAIRGSVPIGSTAFLVGWTIVRWVAAVLCIMLLMSVLYFVGPKRDQSRWRWLTPGALVATLVWVAASLGFSYYTSSFGSYGKTYGAFAGVAILIFWLYITGAVVLLGAEINAETERVQQSKAPRTPVAAGSRAA